MYRRIIKETITNKFFRGKALIFVGARQVGKTTLSEEIIKSSEYSDSIQKFNCDNPSDRDMLNNKDLEYLMNLIGEKKVIFIDEGQKVETIGQTLKLIVDHYKGEKQILITGSSSLNLLESVQEVLTGRKTVYTLYNLSLQEIFPDKDYPGLLKKLPELLIYGSYPEVVTAESFSDKQELLNEIAGSYLYKDILEFQKIKNPTVLNNLLKALALQIGSQVSNNELSSLIGIDKNTVEKYIDLLEKNFIVFRLPPFTRNKRKEISKLKKVYFYDLGIRNTIINNYNTIDMRNDVGGLWENFVIAERMKYREYNKIYASQYFWRTYTGSEIDLVEDREGKLFGYEFKWSMKKKNLKVPQMWQEYSDASLTRISKDDLREFIL